MKKVLFLVFFMNLMLANDLDFNTLKADFTQKVDSRSSSIIYEGYFVADSKKGAFWHYKTPSQKLIYFSSTQIIIIEPDLEQAIITNIKDTPDLRQILQNAKQVEQDIFSCELDGIKYNIKVANSLPAEIFYKDKLDNEVRIFLQNVSKNTSIDNDLLQPNIPQNFDILSE